MKYPACLAGMVLLVGCFSRQPEERSDYQKYEEHLGKLHDKLLAVSVHIGGGTGEPIYVSNGDTYFLTAKHVVGESFIHDVTIYKNESFQKTKGTVVALSPEFDLAIVRVSGIFDCFDIMSDEDYSKLRQCEIVLAAGWPRAQPAIISVGLIRNTFYKEPARPEIWLYHSASGWFGFSGGPVIHLATGLLVGTIVEIRGHNGEMDSSRMIAVPAPQIRKFVKQFLPRVK